MAQLRSMDTHMTTLIHHQRNNVSYPLTSPTGQMHPSNMSSMNLPPPSPHQQHVQHNHLGYHNSLVNFQQQQHQQHQQHNFHGAPNHILSYNNLEDTTDLNDSRISPSMSSSDYLNSMHQMVEANNLTQLQHNNDMNPHAHITTQPPGTSAIINSGVYHSHQQHLAALAAHAQAQVQHDQKVAKSSSSFTTAAATATTTAAAAASLVASTMANQMSAASSYFSNNGAANLVHNLNEYDERSLSSMSNGGDIDAVTDDEDDAKDPSDSHNIDVTSSPQSPQHSNYGNSTGLKRKSSANVSAYCDDLNALNNNNTNDERNSDCLSKNLVNGNSGCGDNYILKSQFEGGVRPRSLEDMQKQNCLSFNGNSAMEHSISGQSQQQQQQKHLDDYSRMHHMSGTGGGGSSIGHSGEQQDRLNDNDSVMNGSCASSEDLNQTNSSEQGEKITSGSDDEGKLFIFNIKPYNFELNKYLTKNTYPLNYSQKNIYVIFVFKYILIYFALYSLRIN